LPQFREVRLFLEAGFAEEPGSSIAAGMITAHGYWQNTGNLAPLIRTMGHNDV
jgi:hypothetical protein